MEGRDFPRFKCFRLILVTHDCTPPYLLIQGADFGKHSYSNARNGALNGYMRNSLEMYLKKQSTGEISKILCV
jgi:hypothetical protein